MKNKLLILILFFVIVAHSQETLHAQEASGSSLILRSTTSISTINSEQQSEYIHQQSTGQASITGTYESGGYFLSQGFVQADVWAKIVDLDDVLDLKVQIFPNPFIDEVHVSFLESLEQSIDVVIFSDTGSKLESVTYESRQDLSVSLKHLPPGRYYIKVATDQRQFVDHLIKLN